MINGFMLRTLLLILWISKGFNGGNCLETSKSISEVSARNATTSKPNIPDCSAEFRVTVEAKAFSIPRSSHGEPLRCSWLLKSDNMNQRIGVTTLNTSLEIGSGECFRLDARDGRNDSSPLLKSIVYCNDTFTAWDWPNEKTIVSSSNYMLLEYSSGGKNPLSMDLLYYTCGGEANSDIYFASPIFDPAFAVTQIVECQWKFNKHPDAIYGSIRLLDVQVNETSILQVCTDGGMKNLNFQFENKNSTSSESTEDNIGKQQGNSTSLEGDIQNFKNITNHSIAVDNSFLRCNNGLPGGNGSVQSVVGGSFNLMIFDGEIILVLYRIQGPRLEVGFNARYFPVKIPKRASPRVIPWYINYSGLTIYTPLGIIIGIVIIGFQNRKRGPSKSELEMIADAILSDPSDSEAALQANLELDELTPRNQVATKTNDGVDLLSPVEEREPFVKPKVKMKSGKEVFVVVSLNDLSKGTVCRTVSGRSLSTTDLDFLNRDQKLKTNFLKSGTIQNLNNNNVGDLV